MKISFTTLGGYLLSIEVPRDATLADLMRVVSETKGYCPGSFSLFMGEDSLQVHPETTSLSEIGIGEGVSISIVQKRICFLTASGDRTAKIWDRMSGGCKLTLSGHSDIVTSAVFSVDESLILTASMDKTAKIWDRMSGECKLTLSGHSVNVTSAVFSAEDSLILTASGDTTAKIWDRMSGEVKLTLSGHYDGLSSAVFTADESLILTASADRTAKIWDRVSGECKQTLIGHSNYVFSAVCSP